MSAVADMYIARYCRGDHTLCARDKVASAGVQVPPDLHPNQQERARQILSQSAGARG